jgi:hypothetical protein
MLRLTAWRLAVFTRAALRAHAAAFAFETCANTKQRISPNEKLLVATTTSRLTTSTVSKTPLPKTFLQFISAIAMPICVSSVFHLWLLS